VGVREPTTTRWRFFRACVFALVAGQLAAAGHLLAGGPLPDMPVLLTVTVLLGGSVSGFATRRRTGPQIFLALAASQVAFHAAFALTAHHDGAVDGTEVAAGRMLAFHLIAAVVATWLMASGESTLFRLFAAWHRVLVGSRVTPAICLPPTWTAATTDVCGAARLRAAELSGVSRRGPPPVS